MTDARISRAHAEALSTTQPAGRISREHLEALADGQPQLRVSRIHGEALWSDLPTVELRLSRAHTESLLVMPQQEARVTGGHVEVLWSDQFVAWKMEDDGPKPMYVEAVETESGTVPVETLGWWDGTTAQPLTPP